MLLLYVSCSNSLFGKHVFKIAVPVQAGTTFVQNDVKQSNEQFCFLDPHKYSIRSLFVLWFALFALFAVPINICSLRPLSKYCFWLQRNAFVAPRAHSAKMSVCITQEVLLISYTILFFIRAFHASNTFLYKISSHFLKICSPPSVGSMILKAAQKQNHEKCAS